jgi:lipopolysaccharide/colanic/teichoic acid biosynthesis glycosyltransferase
VENKSLWLDIKILFLTGYKIFKKENIEHSVAEESARFRGNNK